MNTIGNLLRLTTFGESHGAAMGGVVDGFPAGLRLDLKEIQREVDRRRPGQSALTTPRSEPDKVKFLSGLYRGVTTGQPIGFIIRNRNQRSSDYAELARLLRPSHADFTYLAKYGLRDPRGGGRASARETLCRVVAGAMAKQALRQRGISISAYTSQVGGIVVEKPYWDLDLTQTDAFAVRCPDATAAKAMEGLIAQVRKEGDSIGGVVTCVIQGLPVGLGEPIYGKYSASLASAMMSINAAKGFEIGDGFALASMRGSEANDAFAPSSEGGIGTLTNHSGGIQGGITNGEDVVLRVAFKPTPTIGLEQQTLTREGKAVTMKGRGRHDPCVLPRAVPVVEAMAALTTLDHYLLARSTYQFFPKK